MPNPFNDIYTKTYNRYDTDNAIYDATEIIKYKNNITKGEIDGLLKCFFVTGIKLEADGYGYKRAHGGLIINNDISTKKFNI